MQQYLLIPHPDFACDAVQRIQVELDRGSELEGRFRISGDFSRLRMPSPRESRRADELWRHTCCELFIGPVDAANYYEFNLAPSTEWAAYAFTDYRTGMTQATIAQPTLQVAREKGELLLTAKIDLSSLRSLRDRWRMAVSCVIQQSDGAISYWALRHPPGKPDFHHADGFVLEL